MPKSWSSPWFWRSQTLAARCVTTALTPVALLYQAAHKLRWAMTKPARARVPVICIGNATLGGTGKTPFAIMTAQLLKEEGVTPAFLTRGYGGMEAGPVVVDPKQHDAYEVGDEALLLAKHGLTIVARNRPAGAALAEREDAGVIIMDDGFQNPTLHKDLSVLLMSAGDNASNGKLFPAGPFRETLNDAKDRADITVSTDGEKSGADFHARMTLLEAAPDRVIAFAGIGRPEKFFATLEGAGYELAQRIGFPDHHHYSEAELKFLARESRREKARLVCTEKDAVKLPAYFHENISVLAATMTVDDPGALKRRLMTIIKKTATTTDKA